MDNIDALALSRKLREETSQALNHLNWQEKLELFNKAKNRYIEKINKNNVFIQNVK